MKVIYSDIQIADTIYKIEDQIHEYVRGLDLTEPPIMTCILDGGFRFYADLISTTRMPVKCDFIKVSSYKGKDQGTPKIHKFPKYPINGSTIILVDDILDSGTTINYVIDNLKHYGVKNLAVATLLYRKSSPELSVTHFKGLPLNDEWVAGYGLDDFEGTSRNLNYIYELDKK